MVAPEPAGASGCRIVRLVRPGGFPDPEWFRRMSAPENEMPVALPLNRLLLRTDDLAVFLLGLQVYTAGLSFELVVRVRPAAADRLRLAEVVLFRPYPHDRDRARFLVGVEFADGRRADNLRMEEPGAEVVFTAADGSAGPHGADQTFWLNPLPPDGPLHVVVRCDAIGIPETSAELDGTAIRRAAADVVTLWPWEPPHLDEPPASPPPPDLPADSWFTG